MSSLVFKALEKKSHGTGISRDIRRKGMIPVVVYGFGENHRFMISYKDFLQEYQKGDILSKIVNLKIGNKNYQSQSSNCKSLPVVLIAF